MAIWKRGVKVCTLSVIEECVRLAFAWLWMGGAIVEVGVERDAVLLEGLCVHVEEISVINPLYVEVQHDSVFFFFFLFLNMCTTCWKCWYVTQEGCVRLQECVSLCALRLCCWRWGLPPCVGLGAESRWARDGAENLYWLFLCLRAVLPLSKLTLPAERQIAAFTPGGVFFLSFLIYLSIIYFSIVTMGNVSSISCVRALSVDPSEQFKLKTGGFKEAKLLKDIRLASWTITWRIYRGPNQDEQLFKTFYPPLAQFIYFFLLKTFVFFHSFPCLQCTTLIW